MTKQEQLQTNRLRKRKCRTCKESFRPEVDTQWTCIKVECLTPWAIKETAKAKAREKQSAKKELKENDIQYLLKEAQRVFNKYIRKRDELECCISCGYVFSYLEDEPQGEGRQRQAGHLRPEATYSILRFNEDNVNSQCNYCNDPFYGLKGNVGEYEKNLRLKIGDERVSNLFQERVIKKWTADELKEIIDTYKRKYKELT